MNKLIRLIFRGYGRVENTGSTARDHLANERTYLAWTRTSLGLIALGIGVERFERLRADLKTQIAPASPDIQAEHERQVGHGQQLAGTLLTTGVATLKGVFRPNVHGVALVVVGCACVTTAVVRSELRQAQHLST
ncbi:uncharacterized protein B0H18DRAFT_1015368 [Fomitopsis serialis]|uniref:uncharacterized protein n=1 Tax=Fomitopsis serialis TaxID=139415 RepID=UPI0020087E6D|nr:uncharacterized protein B0H18DRAFT_1015368 [Neoantrodia serialis]KAH9923361.1 hypothetical protein B0H18DRAFT_1015368 [Neoantrodia serialis]